jgi:hypothetical protein
MYARVTTFEGPPARLEEGIRIFQEEVIPWLRDSSGFRGWIALVDREHQRSMGITFWATKEAVLDPDLSGGTLRDVVAESVGVPLGSVGVYEVALADALALEEPS